LIEKKQIASYHNMATRKHNNTYIKTGCWGQYIWNSTNRL